MKKLVIIKSYKDGDTDIAVDTEIEVSAEMAVELIEKGFAKEIEVKVEAIEDTKLSDLEDEVKELKSKLVNLDKKDKGDNKIMNIEVKEQNLSKETKLCNVVKLAKSLATNMWTEETKAIAGQGLTVSGDGGALVDPMIIDGIYSNMIASSQIFSKVGKRPVGDNADSFKIKQLNESKGTPAEYNGIVVEALDEGGAITPQKIAYAPVTVDIKKIGCIVPFTQEILDDVPGIVEFTEKQVGTAFGLTYDNETLYATLARMTAAVGHAGSVAITLADASAPTAKEIRDMFMANANPGVAEWYMSGAVYANLMALESTNGQQLVQPNYNVSPYGTLMGRPVNVVNCMLGENANSGTIGFCDWGNGYLVGTKGGVKMAKSMELYFLTEQTAFRWVSRAGGAPTKAVNMELKDKRKVANLVFGSDS